MHEYLHLEEQEGNACGPAMIRTMIKAGLVLQGKSPKTAPSQKAVAKEVYSWHYWVFYHHPFKFKLRDNWCLPERVQSYLKRWFTGVALFAGEGSTVENLAGQLEAGRAVGVLIQDVIPDKSRPRGYEDNLDNGHWTLVRAVNLREGWVELADSYRDRAGNERWFDDQGVVLTDGTREDRTDLTLEHRRIYRMALADFVKSWWDYKFNPAEGKYFHPAVAVDLTSLTTA